MAESEAAGQYDQKKHDEIVGYVDAVLAKSMEYLGVQVQYSSRTRILGQLGIEGKKKAAVCEHLDAREEVIRDIIGRMRSVVAEGNESPRERTKEQKARFFAQSILNRVRNMRRAGVQFTGLTTKGTYKGNDKIHYREDKESWLGVDKQKERVEDEIKYGVNPFHREFPILSTLSAAGKYEDHEQIYLYVAPNEDGLPEYEVRVRKVTSSDGGVTYFMTIKSTLEGGEQGKKRNEIEFEIGEDLYDAFAKMPMEGYEPLKKRRYFVEDLYDRVVTIDELDLGDGAYDHSCEVEFKPGHTMPFGYVGPAWATGERGEGYGMKDLSKLLGTVKGAIERVDAIRRIGVDEE